MNETWAGVLAISVAVMALVQLAVSIALMIYGRRLMALVQSSHKHIDVLASDVRLRFGAVSDRVNAVADDVRGVTTRVQQVATTVSDGVQKLDQSVRTAGQRVASTIDQVPDSVRKGVPVGLAIVAALRTVRQVRARMREQRA
jgi:uncharacterized protein YoxC